MEVTAMDDGDLGTLETGTESMAIDDTEEDPLDLYMKSLESQHSIETRSNWSDIDRKWQNKVKHDVNATTKNRRYQKLQELLYASDYFSDENMQHRNPGLFDLHLGNYKPDNTPSQATTEETKLSEFLMTSILKKDVEERKAQEELSWGSSFKRKRRVDSHPYDSDDGEEFKEEVDSDDDDNMEMESTRSNDDFTLEERRSDLIDVMSQRFLQGFDSNFINYDEIDSNESFDYSKTSQQDAEDRYFD